MQSPNSLQCLDHVHVRRPQCTNQQDAGLEAAKAAPIPTILRTRGAGTAQREIHNLLPNLTNLICNSEDRSLKVHQRARQILDFVIVPLVRVATTIDQLLELLNRARLNRSHVFLDLSEIGRILLQLAVEVPSLGLEVRDKVAGAPDAFFLAAGTHARCRKTGVVVLGGQFDVLDRVEAARSIALVGRELILHALDVLRVGVERVLHELQAPAEIVGVAGDGLERAAAGGDALLDFGRPLDLLLDEVVDLDDDVLEIFVQLGEAGGRFDVGEVNLDAWDCLLLWLGRSAEDGRALLLRLSS